MRICVSINDTAQVHFWKNIIRTLQDRGHEVVVLSRDTGETGELLRELKIPFHPASANPGFGLQRYLLFPYQVLQMCRYLRGRDIDLITGFGGYNSLAGFLLNRPDISFNDSEPSVYAKSYALIYKIALPLTRVLVTPACFKDDLGRRHIKVDSYKELAYLHPKYFRPNDDIFNVLGISRGEAYFLLRFSAFGATHDARITGFSPAHKIALVKALEKYGRVFISSEAGVPEEIEDRLLRIPKSRIHDVIYYAKMLVTDTGTMATEAAVLGTPVVRSTNIVDNDHGIMSELGRKYGLMLNYARPEDAIARAAEMAGRSDLKATWATMRDRMLEDKIDPVSFMAWFIESYPESEREFRNNPVACGRFKLPAVPAAGTGKKSATI